MTPIRSPLARSMALALAVATLALLPVGALAQGGETPDDRATAFQAVEGPARDSVPGGMLLVAAYGVLWTLLVGFVWRTGRLEREASRELAELRARIEKP